MRPAVLLRLAAAGGRVDALRIALTALGATLAALVLLAAATVVSIAGQADYTNGLLAEPGLRPGVTVALLLLGIPVLFFVGQCVRVGAPARDRRLAAIRMAGATPAQAVTLAAAETGVAALLGTGLGFVAYLVGRALLDSPGPQRPLPTDVLPPWWVLIGIAVAVPVGGALLAALALRRSALTPFGVVRRRPSRPPRVLPAILLVGGTAGLATMGLTLRWLPDDLGQLFVVLGLVLLAVTVTGLVTGVAALSAAIGRWLAPRAGRPDVLLAARRLVADPWAASRSLAAVLAAVLVGAGALLVRSFTLGELAAESTAVNRAGDPQSVDPFYRTAFDLVDLTVWLAIVLAAGGLLVASIEQILERRRSLAALTAGGTPTGVLVRALLLQVALPTVPGVLLALVSGSVVIRALYGSVGERYAEAGGYCTSPADAPATWCDDPTHVSPVVRVAVHNPVPWAHLTALGLGTVAIVVAVTAVSLLLLRRATDVAELRV